MQPPTKPPTPKSQTDPKPTQAPDKSPDAPTREELNQRANELGQGPVADPYPLSPRAMEAHRISQEKMSKGWVPKTRPVYPNPESREKAREKEAKSA